MNYSIRKFVLEDLPDIYANELEYIREIEPKNEERWIASIPKHLKQWISLMNTTFVLDSGTEIVGHFSWMVQDERALLVSIFIKVQYRRLGLASKLLEYFENEARKLGYSECILGVFENNPAEVVYQERGYQYTDASDGYRNFFKQI